VIKSHLSNSCPDPMSTPYDLTSDKTTINAELSEDEGADTDEVSHKIEQDDEGQSGSTSNKKKKKKKSKAKRIIDALSSTNAVPQAVLEKVVEQVKEDGAPGSENIDTEDVRQVLQQIKIKDVLKGKAAIGGNNRKDVGEHKVCFSALVEILTPYLVFSSGVHSPYRNWVSTNFVYEYYRTLIYTHFQGKDHQRRMGTLSLLNLERKYVKSPIRCPPISNGLQSTSMIKPR
jgi:hypothetical protein